MSFQAYQKTVQTTEAPRQTEYRIFAQITGELIRAQENPDNIQALIKALDRNRRLWMILAADCREATNQLPDDLKARIISISIWVTKHSNAVARREESIDELIDVNRTIMQGLQQPVPAPATETAAVPSV